MLGILQEVSVDILGIDRNTALGVFGSTGQAESDAREFETRRDFRGHLGVSAAEAEQQQK